MRKRIVGLPAGENPAIDAEWLDLEALAEAEITSESEAHPIESALTSDIGPGWRAAHRGKQMIRLVFDRPRSMRRIRLVFREEDRPRTQEFVLRWLPRGEVVPREIVRQQYHFSPPGTTEEIEEYCVELEDVAALELGIVPDIGGEDAHATLAELRVA